MARCPTSLTHTFPADVNEYAFQGLFRPCFPLFVLLLVILPLKMSPKHNAEVLSHVSKDTKPMATPYSEIMGIN
jgi:hypothetical protein